jgi:hypothetical protein
MKKIEFGDDFGIFSEKSEQNVNTGIETNKKLFFDYLGKVYNEYRKNS